MSISLSIPGSASARAVPDYRFGVVEAYAAPGAASVLGAGWERVTFRWNEIQAGGPDEWNLPITDAQLTAELNAGRQVVGLLVNTPGWATDLGIGPGVPMGLYLPASDPANAWANFVRAIVGRYAGRIDHWVIWNEPDIWESYHMSWGGSVEDYAQLLRVSHAAAHEANPGVVLHLAAMTHWWDVNYGRDLFFRRLMDVLMVDPNAPQNGYYFDVASMHVYFNPETLYDLTSLYLGIMWERGIRKPVWIMETNAAPSQDPSWPVASPQFNVSLNDQAAFVVQAFTLGIAAGAQRIAVYKLADTAQDAAANPEPFGLVRADGTRRPAFTAFQVASTYLAGFRSATVDQRDALMQVTVDRGDSVTTVAWARTAEGQTAAVFARATSALLVDMWGGARRIYPERGYYFVSLPGASCTDSRCIVGGLPLMVVENAPAGSGAPPPPPAPTVPPSQGGDEVLPSPTPDPNLQGFATPLPTNTPTPTATSTPTRTPRPSPTATATPTDTPTATPTATATATATPTPTPTASPTPTPTPVTFAGELRRVTQGEWVLGGVLLAGLGALTLARRMRKR